MALHRTYVLARLCRESSPEAQAAAFGAPADSFWLGIDEHEREAWRAVHRAQEAGASFAKVSLLGHRDLGVCRVERRDYHGAMVWAVTPLSRYPWRVVLVRPHSVHAVDPVDDKSAIAFARRTRAAAERAAAAAEAEDRARREGLAAATAAIEDAGNGWRYRVTLRGHAGSANELLRPLPRALWRALHPERAHEFLRVSHALQDDVLCLDVEATELDALAGTIASMGAGRVEMPASAGGGPYVPPQPDESDPFESVAAELAEPDDGAPYVDEF